MPLSTNPVFVQGARDFAAKITAANTALDGSGVITELVTAGANGSLVTALQARAQATVTATALRLFQSLDGGATWSMIDEKLMAAYTVAQTTAQTPVTFVSKTSPDQAIELGPNVKLGATIGVALAGGIVFAGSVRDF